MRRILRSVGSTTLALALTVSAAAGPVVRAQDTATDLPFCAILTAEEVTAAVGMPMEPDSLLSDPPASTCGYASTDTGTYTIFSIGVGDTTLDDARSNPFSGETEDLTVADKPSLFSPGEVRPELWVELDPATSLELAITGPPEGLDARATLIGLAELAVPRLATLVIPSPTPVPTGTPFVQGDPELVALFPTEIGGQPVPVATYGAEGLTIAGDDAEAVARLDAALASVGKTTADLSAGLVFSGDPAYSIVAIRVRDADINAITDDLIAIAAQGAEVTPTPAQIAGKDVLVATIGGQTQHAYPRNDVFWVVTAEEPLLTEIFQKLP